MKILPKIIRIAGVLVSAVMLGVVFYNKFIEDQPARVKLSMLGSMVSIILFLLLIRVFKLFLKNKLSAIATAKELNVAGKTRPFFEILLKMFYVFYPGMVLVLFSYGLEMYSGSLWKNVLTMIGCVAIYFVFDFVSLWLERYSIKKEQLKNIENEKEELADRVAQKITFEINKK